MAHAAFGHNHFFKNNYLFRQWTNADGILDYLAFAKRYISACEERYGRDDVEAVIRAIIKASRDFAADPQKWVDAMAKARPDISVDTLKELADNYKNSWSVNGGMNRKELDYTVGWLYEGEDFKNLPEVPFEKWADLSLVDDVLADIGKADGEDQPVR